MTTKVDTRKQSNNDLPSTTKVIHIDYVDKDTGKHYGDDFTIRRLTIGDIRRMAVKRAELNGGQSEAAIGPYVFSLNTTLAHLYVGVVKAPAWWDPESLYDGDVVNMVYEQLMDFQDSFRVPVRNGQGSGEPPTTPDSALETP